MHGINSTLQERAVPLRAGLPRSPGQCAGKTQFIGREFIPGQLCRHPCRSGFAILT